MAPKETRWGILGAGGIAATFAKDLTADPSTRGVSDVKHVIAAAGTSNSASRAQDFLKKAGAPAEAKAYGSYAELVKDPNVDIIYVATPHSHHYQHARLALEAGKNVLCEKAFTVNAEQTKILVKLAREKNLFLMEAVWTRYFPLSIWVREMCTSSKMGPIQRVFANLSVNFVDTEDPSKTDNSSRMVNMDLAGGGLLDLGIYSLTWLFQTLYTTQPAESRKPPRVASFIKPYEPTGADEMTTMILEFPRPANLGGTAHGIATCGVNVPDAEGGAPPIRIQGTRGEIHVYEKAYRPIRTKLVLNDGTIEDKDWPLPGPGKGSGWFNGFGDHNAEGEGHGMFWEADEAARALSEGRKEGQYESLDESVVIMETMDEVRRQGGLKYPEAIETTKYPAEL